MGYTTYFSGAFQVTPTLKDEDREFLKKLNETRRMKRDVGPEYGVEGEWYVDGGGFAGQDHEDNIVSFNSPPSTQPGLWCQWVPNENGSAIEWDEGEKFYEYERWLEYLIENYLKPRGYELNGEVEWSGEDDDDRGKLIVEENRIRIQHAEIYWRDVN